MANQPPVILVVSEKSKARRKAMRKLDAALKSFRAIEADSIEAAARECGRPSVVDFIVLDTALVERAGTRALDRLSALQPDARFLTFGPSRARDLAIKMLEAGAAAYLPCDLGPAEIAKAFDLVASGAIFAPLSATWNEGGAATASRAVIVPFPAPRSDPGSLSSHQWAIMSLLARGRSNAEIGFLLGQSESAMATQVAALMRRLGLDAPSAPAAGPPGDGHGGGSGARGAGDV